MSESQHTPGPWSWIDGRTTGFKTATGGESILARARPSDDFFVLKIAEMDSNVPVHEREANARLIAAAPEMFEAADKIAADYQTSDSHHPDHVLIRRQDFDALLAARAKATGAAA